jgi:predicted site-specific integrase-resolvase
MARKLSDKTLEELYVQEKISSTAEKVIRLQALLRIAAEARNEEVIDKYYLTAEEFVENLMPPMKEYIIKMYGKEECHPHDLATAAASFMDAYWIISEHRPL